MYKQNLNGDQKELVLGPPHLTETGRVFFTPGFRFVVATGHRWSFVEIVLVSTIDLQRDNRTNNPAHKVLSFRLLKFFRMYFVKKIFYVLGVHNVFNFVDLYINVRSFIRTICTRILPQS